MADLDKLAIRLGKLQAAGILRDGEAERAIDQAKAQQAATKKSLGQRLYAGARAGRLMFSASISSANAELYSSLDSLRSRSRALCRDNVYAKRAKQILVDNVIGKGMGMQAQVTNRRGRLLKGVNDPIEEAWCEWGHPDTCHTGGVLHFSDIERAAMGEVFEAGEVIIRIHRQPFGKGTIPLALELVEAERLASDYEIKVAPGTRVTMGIEHDRFHRPVAYYIHTVHPHEMQAYTGQLADEIERVPAADIIHIKITERWPQVRGVPWMHAAINYLNQLGEFYESAVIAARMGADKAMMLRETDQGGLAEALGEDDGKNDGTLSWSSSKGQVDILPAGTEVVDWTPAYPEQNFDPFTRAILRGIAAGVPGLYYSGLSQDYSQANYSSERSATLDTRGTWQAFQTWWIRTFRSPLHKQWLNAAMLARAIPGVDLLAYASDIERYEEVKFKPRGWSWVDPTKEVNAYKEAEKAGYITKTQIIAATNGGLDLEDVARERRRELDMLAELDIETDTTVPDPVAPPAAATSGSTPMPPEPVDPNSADDAQPARVFAFKRDHE